MNTQLLDKFQGCIFGGAVGDALGYQIEFKRNIRERQVTDFKEKPGIVSDDTQMTLFTANGLLWQKTNTILGRTTLTPAHGVYEAYLDWFDTQEGFPNHKSISWIKDIPELNKMRAPGNTCLRSLQSRTMGTIEERINDSKGCGSVMRIAPCALMAQSAQEAARLASACGAITHGHTLALYPCYVCAYMIYSITFENTSLRTALDEAIGALKAEKHLFGDKPMYFRSSHLAPFVELIEKAIKLSKQKMSDTRAIRMLGEGWVAEEAFAIALYACLKYPDNFQDAIVAAINHDGDSDSTGAIAGNIMGALLGMKQIPSYELELTAIMLELAEDMYKSRILETDNSLYNDAYWLKKYRDCNIS